MQNFDIAIVGGGMIGMAMANAIGKLLPNLSCILLDKSSISNSDNRGIALSYTSLQILGKLGLQDIQGYPIYSVHVSNRGKFGITKLSNNNLPMLGQVISAIDLGLKLAENNYHNISIQRPTEIKKLIQAIDGWQIITDKHTFHAKLLIAADGSNSWVRTQLHIGIDKFDYQQHAIVCNVNCQKPHKGVAYERFVDDGVIAVLPFGYNHVKCILTVANSKLDYYKKIKDDEFLQILQTKFGFRLGILSNCSARFYYPLYRITANKVVAEKSILIGNAANTLSPVAAQGLNLGLRDVFVLSNLLANNTPLDKFQTLRAKDYKTTNNFTHLLTKVFADNSWAHLGLLAANFIPQILIEQGIRSKPIREYL